MEKLRVPENLEINDLLELYPVYGLNGFHKDKVYFVCDSIYRGMEEFNSDNTHPDKREPYFVPLQTKILKKILGGNCYKSILDWMKEASIIIPDGSWQADNVSQGYKFTEYFIDQDITWKTVSCNTILKKEVENICDIKYYFQTAIAQRLKKWFDPKRLKIDVSNALEINNLVLKSTILLAKDNTGKIRQARFNAMANQTKIENIENGKYLFKQDQFGYRLHTSITQLPKEFRSLVTYDDKQLVEVDISCSQLFFSCFLLDYRHWNTPKFKSKTKFTKDLWEKISIIYNKSTNNQIVYNNTIMCIKSLETSFGKGFQQHDFFKKCCDGIVYESIVDCLDSKKYFSAKFDYESKRKQVKTILLDQIFADPKDKKHRGLFCPANKPILDCFTTLYPDVAYVYDQIKEGYFKDLCSLLQRIESITILGKVCKRMQAEFADIPIFTLHDCLITTLGNELLIRQVMEEEISMYIGYAPKMKIKYWSDYAELIPEAFATKKAA